MAYSDLSHMMQGFKQVVNRYFYMFSSEFSILIFQKVLKRNVRMNIQQII